MSVKLVERDINLPDGQTVSCRKTGRQTQKGVVHIADNAAADLLKLFGKDAIKPVKAKRPRKVKAAPVSPAPVE